MIVLVSQDGFVNKTPLEVHRTHRGGPGKSLTTRWAHVLWEPEDGKSHDLLMLTNLGGIFRVSLSEIRPSGGLARGVRVFRLEDYESIQDAVIVEVPA